MPRRRLRDGRRAGATTERVAPCASAVERFRQHVLRESGVDPALALADVAEAP